MDVGLVEGGDGSRAEETCKEGRDDAGEAESLETGKQGGTGEAGVSEEIEMLCDAARDIARVQMGAAKPTRVRVAL